MFLKINQEKNNLKAKAFTLGCKVNQYETEAMLEILQANNINIAKNDETPQIIIINTCTVTGESDNKAKKLLRRCYREYPESVIVLAGCFTQVAVNINELSMFADIIIGTKNRSKIYDYISEYIDNREKIIDIPKHLKGEKFEALKIKSFNERTRAFIKIEDGCNRFCSYCIIPYARGMVRSKPLNDILEEVKGIADSGYKEIVLTGINLTAYGEDIIDQKIDLADIINAVSKIEKIERIRLGSLEPDKLNDAIINKLAVNPKLCPHFHLSLQSGCDETLKRMNRHYSCEDYYKLCKKLKEVFENPSITTDIMVGFPSESDEEFKETLEFAKKIGFLKVHVFSYSVRGGTAAEKLKNHIDENIKAKRNKILRNEMDISQQDFLKKQIGKELSVIFERETDGYCYGFTPQYFEIKVRGIKALIGKNCLVKITGYEDSCCIGSLI